MRDANVYNLTRAFPRMSWHPRNLYNLYRRSVGDRAADASFSSSNKSLFQQRWTSKALVRAYHGDFINEKSFKRWYLPSTLPDVRPARRARGDDSAELRGYAGLGRQVAREERRREEDTKLALAPVGSLMFSEVERRIDVLIFRACLAPSVYEARRLVLHGRVLLNGVKYDNPNTRVAPGDMISVDPTAIRFLQASAAPATPAPTPPAASSTPAASSSDDEDLSYPSLRSRIEDDDDTEKPALTPFHLPPYAAPFVFIPAYLEVSFATCSLIYVRHPTARAEYSEIPTPYDADGEVVRLAWEWYKRVRPKMRSKSQLARMPANRR